MDMKGMNPYQHFGLRQAWLEHFYNIGLKCFSQDEEDKKYQVLGYRQYEGLRAWLRESGLIKIENKSLKETELLEKIKPYGIYNPYTWAIIWANLAYNSVISRWYCLHTDLGATYEKADLVTMIGENYSKSTRDNAVTALTETLRDSPIGSFLKQGIPLELTKNTFSYYREGWDYPSAVALLYALYLYAEHTGRKTFSFTELINARKNPDSKGISPHDIYGIDAKAFREQVQGLATTYPEYIRVSFVANLDNIILGDYSSNDIVELEEKD